MGFLFRQHTLPPSFLKGGLPSRAAHSVPSGLRPLLWLTLLCLLWPTQAGAQQDESAAETEKEQTYIIAHTLNLPKGRIYAALFSPDEKNLVTLDGNHTLRFRDTRSARLVREIRTKTHQAISALFHPTEQVLFTGGKDRTVRAWDIIRGNATLKLEGFTGVVKTLLSDREGKVLFTGDANGRVEIWDVEAGKRLRVLEGHGSPITALALHPAGKLLASGAKDRGILIWDWQQGVQRNALRGHTGPITALRFSPDKPQVLASASADGTVKLWDWEEHQNQDFATLQKHKRAVTAIAFHPNRKWLLSSSLDKRITIWSIQKQRVLQEVALAEGPIAIMDLSSSGRHILGAYLKGRVRTWRLGKSAYLATLSGHTQAVNALDFTQDNQFLISASQDKTIKIWNLNTRSAVRSYPTRNQQVQALRLSPDNRSFASAGTDGFVRIWDTASGKERGKLRGHEGKVNAIAYHPKGRFLLSGGSDKSWVLWDLTQGKIHKRMSGHGHQVTGVAFAPNGQEFATASEDKTLRLWSFPQGELRNTLTGHEAGVQAVRYDLQNLHVISADKAGVIKIWMLKNGKLRYDLMAHDFIISDIRLNPVSGGLVSVSRDKTVKLWNAETGTFRRTLSGERHQLLSLAISADGKTVAVSSLDKDIVLMDYPPMLIQEQKNTAKTQGASLRSPGGEAAAAPVTPLPPPSGAAQTDPLALHATEDSGAKLAYRQVESKDPRLELKALQEKLNTLMRTNRFCENAKAIDKLAHDILQIAPYDKAAYHAVINTAVVSQDLKRIFLMVKLGRKALFFREVYDYATPEEVEARLIFWEESVFNPTRERSGRELELEFIGCDGGPRIQKIAAYMLALDLPRQALNIIASRKVKVDFTQFKALSNTRFANRLFYLVAQALRSGNTGPAAVLSLEDAPSLRMGLLALDLSALDVIGETGHITFQLRRADGDWMGYFTDKDRRKRLLLPVDNYYLQVEHKVVNAFRIASQQTRTVVVKP